MYKGMSSIEAPKENLIWSLPFPEDKNRNFQYSNLIVFVVINLCFQHEICTRRLVLYPKGNLKDRGKGYASLYSN